jgi:SAM-dependent methyltransferase
MDFYGLDIVKHWHNSFLEKIAEGVDLNDRAFLPEPRVQECAKRCRIRNARILELGSLEGIHALMFQRLGAREVVGIEGRKVNFLKCALVKNAFSLNRCRFVFGDIKTVLPILKGPFDLCVALGVLYHLDNPVDVIEKIARVARSLFVWTHYSVEDIPSGPFLQMRHRDKEYRGKNVTERIEECLSGLTPTSFRLTEEDLLRAVKEAGFCKIEVIGKEAHRSGPAMTFFAQK